jgi:hypothetical protein
LTLSTHVGTCIHAVKTAIQCATNPTVPVAQ